jgi:hypothetical protein
LAGFELEEKEGKMRANIRNGTPLHGKSLCETCLNAHIERGYRESEEMVHCQATYPDHRVLFRIRECSSYTEKKRQTLYQMEKVAWVLDTKGSTRKLGFVSPEEARKDLDPIELILSERDQVPSSQRK